MCFASSKWKLTWPKFGEAAISTSVKAFYLKRGQMDVMTSMTARESNENILISHTFKLFYFRWAKQTCCMLPAQYHTADRHQPAVEHSGAFSSLRDGSFPHKLVEIKYRAKRKEIMNIGFVFIRWLKTRGYMCTNVVRIGWMFSYGTVLDLPNLKLIMSIK